MKKHTLLFAGIILLIISGCCHKKNIVIQQAGNNTASSQLSLVKDDYLKFGAYYYHTTESTYEEVSIKEGKLTFTYFKGEKNNFSSDSDPKVLSKKDTILSKQDIDTLTQKIEKYGFGKLDTVIGNPAESEKYYTFTLSFKTSSIDKAVMFKSVPGGITMPDAFRNSRDELMKLVRKKFGFN
jgi:hypothetical protein